MWLNGLPPVMRLSGAAWHRVRTVARRATPDECCGALIGDSGEPIDVRRALAVPNRAAHPHDEYLIAPRAVQRLERAAGACGLDVVGFFHSHPAGSAAPSARDLAGAWPGYVYLILAGDESAAAWRLAEDRSGFLPVRIVVDG